MTDDIVEDSPRSLKPIIEDPHVVEDASQMRRMPHFANESINLAMDIIFARERSLLIRRHLQTAITRASSVNPYNVQNFDVLVSITMRISKLMNLENFAQELNDTFIFESAAFAVLIAHFMWSNLCCHVAQPDARERANIELLWQHINFLYVPICKFREYDVQCSAPMWESVNTMWRAYSSVCAQVASV